MLKSSTEGRIERPYRRTPQTAQRYDFAAGARQLWTPLQLVLLNIWLGGAAWCALVAATRIVQFERHLHSTLPASEHVQSLAREIACKLGVRRAPVVRCAECTDVPLLWCVGKRPKVVLPMRLVSRLDDEGLALILVHELAHLRRGDHLVRIVELLVSVVYWWNPMAWIARRQIHQAEEFCCDAWVRWAFPDCKRRYAELMLSVAESLGRPQRGPQLLPASSFLRSSFLKVRIEMMLESRFAPRVSRKSLFLLALVASLVVPSFVDIGRTEARGGSQDECANESTGELQKKMAKSIETRQNLLDARNQLEPADRLFRKENTTRVQREARSVVAEPAALETQLAEAALAASEHGQPPRADRKPETSAGSEFPFMVPFEQGVTRFDKGDNIKIVEIRGTAETFVPGNLYVIKGTYTLTSREKASICAFTTAAEAKDGVSVPLKVQSVVVDKGHGRFTLFLPMKYRGWPHVSFYPTPGGEGFGGNYFGTGESVLKRWWGEKE